MVWTRAMPQSVGKNDFRPILAVSKNSRSVADFLAREPCDFSENSIPLLAIPIGKLETIMQRKKASGAVKPTPTPLSESEIAERLKNALLRFVSYAQPAFHAQSTHDFRSYRSEFLGFLRLGKYKDDAERIIKICQKQEPIAEATTKKTRTEAFQEWWSRFRNKFKVAKCEALPAADFPSVKTWYQQQMAILTRGLKRKAPAQWQSARITSIKAAMREMGRTNADYYPELATRLKIKPFESLKDLTKTNLDRVYSRVMDDKRNVR